MALLDSPDKFLNDTRQPNQKHYRYNNRKERQRAREYSNEIHVTSRCTHCQQTFTGRLEDGREWFHNHPCQRG